MDRKKEVVFALVTVLITVPCFVVYCLSLENGGILNIDPKMILVLVPIEFTLAFLSEIFLVGPRAFKIANRAVPYKDYPLVLEETSIICTTVCMMCPWMSFLATILYKGIFPGLIFNDPSFTIGNFFVKFIPNFLQTFILNFPFAILSQLFFIQPLTRKIMSLLFRK